MAKTFKVESESDIENVTAYLHTMQVMNGKVLSVDVKQFREDIPQKQRALYKIWVKAFANHLGWEEQDMDLFFKETFLLYIYVTNDVNGYGKLGESMKVLKADNHESFGDIRQHVIESLSISDKASKQGFKTNLMSQYMEKIKIWCAVEHNFNVPIREEERMLLHYEQ